ncbi:MAG TPA: 3-deoxy-manno-octulosonate cytidylyltransferase [Steroidobacteraceae bacterium]|nr:3-deoxy-manno-octulosonate cytidylyltransferase [Steroidobacteraceae bacterium]
MFRVVIPARFDSARLPGKVLLPLSGRPMLQWVCERAQRSGARATVVATDDGRIATAAAAVGVPVIMTAATHASGTDRIAEAAVKLGWDGDDIVVNLQADEPLMPPALIVQAARLLQEHPGADVGTLASPVSSLAELLDPNAVKVVTDGEGRALYFSRAPIPWDRDGAAAGTQTRTTAARRHIGLYSYRVRSLLRLSQLPPSPLEACEKLEQLRALSAGMCIQVADAAERPGPDVNTPEDLQRVQALLARQS